jgi:hypothetical protein
MRSNQISPAIAVILLFACGLARVQGAPKFHSRAEFVTAMANIKAGISTNDVMEILGKPDDVRTQFDPDGIHRVNTQEIWCYGAQSHLSFPTLGCVYVDINGQAQESYGGRGEPPRPNLFAEDELRDLLRLLDTAPGMEGWNYNPLPEIQIVNRLQPLGKEKALAVIAEYVRVSDEWSGFGGSRSGMFLVLAVLFDLPAGVYSAQAGSFGAPSPGPPKDPDRIPRFPIAIVDDIPFMLVNGYMLAGRATPMENVVNFYQAKGSIRTRPLLPGSDPLASIAHLTNSEQWIYGDTNLQRTEHSLSFGPIEDSEREQAMLMEQLLRLIDSVYRLPTDAMGSRLPWGEERDPAWKRIVSEVSTLKIKWDPQQNIFVFQEGTHLAPPERQNYQRQIWKLAGLGYDRAELVLERKDPNWLHVIVNWTDTKEAKLIPAVLYLFNGNEADKPIFTSRLVNRKGNGGSSSESSIIALKPGSEVFARLVTWDHHTNSSPIFEP